MLVWVALCAAQSPSADQSAANIGKSRQIVLDYVRSLPDFVCTEIIQRYSDPDARGNWYLGDTLTVKLTYFQEKEDHKLVLVDGKPTDRPYDSLDGAIGVGQFGGMLQNIFVPASQAEFRFAGWKDLQGRAVAEYSYGVDPDHSHYTLRYGLPGDIHSAIVGYHGVVDIDRQTGAVLHFTNQADRIPPELGLDSTTSSIYFDLVDIGGQSYLLPSGAQTEMRTPKLWARNDISFREYGKFSSDSSISFGAGK